MKKNSLILLAMLLTLFMSSSLEADGISLRISKSYSLGLGNLSDESLGGFDLNINILDNLHIGLSYTSFDSTTSTKYFYRYNSSYYKASIVHSFLTFNLGWSFNFGKHLSISPYIGGGFDSTYYESVDGHPATVLYTDDDGVYTEVSGFKGAGLISTGLDICYSVPKTLFNIGLKGEIDYSFMEEDEKLIATLSVYFETFLMKW